MLNSIQDKLTRVRPPRVKIVYDVETGGAIEQIELPFIVGIFANLVGKPEDGEAPSLTEKDLLALHRTESVEPADGEETSDNEEDTPPPVKERPPVKDRKMVEIDRDNFDKVMASVIPRMMLSKVEKVIPGDDEELPPRPEEGDGAAQPITEQTATGTAAQTEAEGPKLSGKLMFTELGHFEPVAIVKRVPALNAWYTRRGLLREIQAKAESCDELMDVLDAAVGKDTGQSAGQESTDGAAALEDLIGALDELIKASADTQTTDSGTPEEPKNEVLRSLGLDESQRKPTWEALGTFKAHILEPLKIKDGGDSTDDGKDAPTDTLSAAQRIDHRVKDIDYWLGRQLDKIMHAKVFQQLEATWRGLHYLIYRSATGELLKLRVLDVEKGELRKDLQKAIEFDQSAIFKMIYEAEYGTYGGFPYSLLVGDYEFGRHPDDIGLLEKMAEIAAASHAPFISSAYAKLFDLNSFENLAKPRDLAKIFESRELDRWRDFRKSEDSRYVTLALPRVLLRLPYCEDTNPVEGLRYEEDVLDHRHRPQKSDTGKVPDPNSFLWGNAAYILAERITNAFSLYRWTAAIRGVEGGGLVEHLPTYKFKTNEGDLDMICPTQVAITDRREKELNDLGFMAICHCKGSTKAAFFGGQTTNRPTKYFSDVANANAQLSARLPYMLAASRFAHYVKVIIRDKIGSFLTRANVEDYLNSWIAQYVLLDDDATQSVKAAYPLRAAKVVVTEETGSPGAYKATMFLRPHFQLEELTTSIRLVANLPTG